MMSFNRLIIKLLCKQIATPCETQYKKNTEVQKIVFYYQSYQNIQFSIVRTGPIQARWHKMF